MRIRAGGWSALHCAGLRHCPGQDADILERAHQHKGTSFVEIYQNCIVYNDAAFEKFASKKAAPDALLWLEHGKPMLFANGTKGLRLNRGHLALEVVPVTDGNVEGLTYSSMTKPTRRLRSFFSTCPSEISRWRLE